MKKSGLSKIFSVVFAAAFLAVFTGCRSSRFYLNDCAPIAIMTVQGNPLVPWDAESMKNEALNDVDYDEKGSGVLTNLASKLVSKENPEILEAQDRVDYAAQALHDLLPLTAGIDVIPHEDLMESEAYSYINESIFDYLEKMLNATDYINCFRVGSKTLRMVMDEIGAKGILMAEFTFQKTTVSGNTWTGELAAKVKLRVKFIDSKGKERIRKEFTAVSPDRVKVLKRKYDKERLVASFPAITDTVINQFIVNYMQ